MPFQEVFDVVVIGGGLSGTAVARDCAMRRLSVLLVERDDIGCGATEILSPLVDGGNRLWAKRSHPRLLQEFDTLERLAPHLFSEVRVLVPAVASVARTTLRRLQSTLTSYQKGVSSTHDRRVVSWNADEFKRRFSRTPGHTAGGIEYGQVLWDPVRFAIATARGAKQASAKILLKTTAEEIGVENGRVVGVRLRTAGARSEFAFAKTVVVAAGAAASRIKGMPIGPAPLQKETVLLLGEKFPAGLAMLSDDEATFFVPWRNQTWVGSWTDPFAGNPFETEASPDRVRLIERQVVQSPLFSPRPRPARVMTRTQVADKSPLSFAEPHVVELTPSGLKGLYLIEGGNAGFSREVAERVTTQISDSLRHKEECRTAFESLPGGSHEIPWEEEAQRTGLPPAVVLGLIRRHGYHATTIFERALSNAELARTVCECEGIIAAEIEFCVKEEWATDLQGLSRRTGVGAGICQSGRCLYNAAFWLKKILGLEDGLPFGEAEQWISHRHAAGGLLAQGPLAAQLELNRYRDAGYGTEEER